MTNVETERPPHPKATASYRGLVKKHDLDTRIVSLADRSDELREASGVVPAGTGDLLLEAVRTRIQDATTTDVTRYRDADVRENEDDHLRQILPAIKRAANTVAYRWPGTVTPDELFQSLCVHFLERKGSLAKLAGMVPGERDASLTRVGHQIASEARDDYEQFSGQYVYSVDEVRKMLEKGKLDGQLEGYIAATADLLLGFDQLSAQYREALQLRYVEGLPFPKDKRGENALLRAVDELTIQMNRIRISDNREYRNGGRKRQSVPNIEALAQSELDYDGEEIEDDDE